MTQNVHISQTENSQPYGESLSSYTKVFPILQLYSLCYLAKQGTVDYFHALINIWPSDIQTNFCEHLDTYIIVTVL